MRKEDILKNFIENEIHTIPVLSNLEYEDLDIILAENSLEGFIEFCKVTDKKTIFFDMSFIEGKYFYIDIEKFYIDIEEVVQKLLNECYFYDDEERLTIKDFEDDIAKVMKEVQNHNHSVGKRMSRLKHPEIMLAQFFTIYEGMKVGIVLVGEGMTGIPLALEMEESLKEMLMSLIESKLDNFDADESRYERYARKMELQKKEAENKKERVLEEIKEFINGDQTLLDCTNQTLRHAYSKRLAKEYNEKYNLQYNSSIAISDVKAIVEEFYKKFKTNFRR